jgi:hypothetical protein
VNDQDWRAERFETSGPQLRVVAYRMLGSLSEADDAVQGSLASPQPRLTTDSLRGRSRVAHAPISYSARVTSHVPGLQAVPGRDQRPRRPKSATSHHYSDQHDEHPHTSTTRRKRVNSPGNEQQSSGQTLL